METILVPTDFSPAASNAVDYAIELAKFFNAKLVLVNAYPIPAVGYETGLSMDMVKAIQDSSEEGLENLKKEITEKHHRDFDMQYFSAMGYASDVIKEAAKKYNVDLIVMGITGQAGAIKEHLIGSTAVTTARHSEIPVFIIPEGIKYHRIHKISFACDMEKTEESTMIYISKYFAKLFDAELEIVNIESPVKEKTLEKVNTSRFIEKKLDTTKHSTVFVNEKDPAKGLEHYFESHKTDVLMLNPKKHNVFHNLFNESVTKELAFHVHLPILTIH